MVCRPRRALVSGLVSAVFLGGILEAATPLYEVTVGKPGPWGILETYEMRLEPPSEYAEAAVNSDLRDLVWRFVGQNSQTLGSALREAGLSEEQVEVLTEPSRVRVLEDRIELVPPDDLVFSLDPKVRARLYELLKDDPETSIYRFPYVLDPRWYDETSAMADVKPDLVEKVRQLSYFQEDVPVFSDMPLMLKQVRTPEERLRLVRSMLRERSLAVRLRIGRDSDIQSLSQYWAAGGRNRDILPILESVLTTEGVERLDLVHLLPPLPRMLLYTYANPSMAVGVTRPDCFWSAANFFNYSPSDRFLDATAFEKRLMERFEEVTGEPRFGDVVLITDEDKLQSMHACNYLADGLVFTKNGRSFSRPWVVDRLEEVLAGYLKVPNVSVRYFRQKALIHTQP